LTLSGAPGYTEAHIDDKENAMGAIEFTQNYQDHSTDMGFQFKFMCDRCHDGFMSTFKSNTLGVAGSVLRGANSLLGGIFGKASDSAFEIERMVNGPQHDHALQDAVAEIKPLFQKCRRCGTWVCGKTCFNGEKGMCKQCAPISEEEETSMRADHVRTQVGNDMALEETQRVAEKAKEVNQTCECGAPTLGQKFCPGCGKKLAASTAFCGNCGAKLTPGAKFCGECGSKSP
jgi:hypothetical protein